jgi:putative hydrolase of the HAD superfamily
MTKRNAPATVFVDADNTLWDTDGVFATAQLKLLGAIEDVTGRKCSEIDRLAFVRVMDQGLAERHHSGLRYPPRMLVNALAAVLHGEDSERAVGRTLTGSGIVHIDEEIAASIVESYFVNISLLPVLRPGVEAGLLALRDAHCSVLILTESAQAKVARTAEQLGLNGFFVRIIEGVKRPDLYRRVLRLTKMPNHAFMIGDQLDRDISPAQAAGLKTIYFPGGFRPRWAIKMDGVRPDYVVASFAEVPSIVLTSSLQGNQSRGL